MPIRKEQENQTFRNQIINRGEYHIPVSVVLNVSWKDSEEYKRTVSQTVTEFLDAAKADSFASGRLELCLIASNNGGQILKSFRAPASLSVPTMDSLKRKGKKDIDAAIQEALCQIEQRITLYKKLGVPNYYSPSLYIFSSGDNLPLNNTTIELIRRKQNKRKLLCFSVSLTDPADCSALLELQNNIAGIQTLMPSYSVFHDVFTHLAFSHSVQFSTSKRTVFEESSSPDTPSAQSNLRPFPSSIEIGI